MPLARGHRLLGAGYTYELDRVSALRRWAEELGDVYRFGPESVVVNDPDLVQDVLAATGRDFHAATPLIEDRGDAEENRLLWMRGRRQGGRGMHPDVINGCGRKLDDGLKRALRRIAGRRLDLVEACERVTGHVVTDLCLGPDAPDFYEELAGASTDILAVSRTLNTPLWQTKRRFRRAAAAEEQLKDKLWRLVEARRARGGPYTHDDMLDVLLSRQRPLPGEVIAALLRITLIGGHGTPGAALAWIVTVLCRRPDLAARVCDEEPQWRAQAASGGVRLPPYTVAVVKEILRMYPPTWLLARSTPRDVELGAWTLKAGSKIVFSPLLIQRDPRWWSAPNEIKPERWLEDAVPPRRGAYLPFGGGPRVCPGARLGVAVLAVAALRILSDYRMTVTGSAEPSPDVLYVPRDSQLLIEPV